MAVMESKAMAVGRPLVPFHLKNPNGDMVHSDSFHKHKLLLLVFTCNHCPYAKASWPLLIDLQERYANRGLQVIAINPNNHPNYPDDHFETMRVYVQENGIHFPYLFDEEQATARAYDAVCTPDPFLFVRADLNSVPSLFYHGRLNDNWQDETQVKEKSMELFILAALEEGKKPSRVYPSLGCSIKWV